MYETESNINIVLDKVLEITHFRVGTFIFKIGARPNTLILITYKCLSAKKVVRSDSLTSTNENLNAKIETTFYCSLILEYTIES